jgi:X-Pro dipeptidyl-peptidase
LKSIDRVSGDYNAFWEARDYWKQLDKVHAAVLLAHGLNDWNVMPEHSVHLFTEFKKRGVPTQLYLHQGGHGGDPPFEMMNRWFTRYLCDVENGVEDDPKCFVVREGARTPTPYPDYPNPEAKVVTLRPSKGGAAVGGLALSDGGGATAKLVESLVDDASISGGELATAADSKNRLLYATPPLAAPVHTSGTPHVKLRLASSKAAANLTVWIVELPYADGRNINDHLVNRGWADPQNRESLSKSEPLVPGQFYDVQFDLQPDDQVIAAGKRLALMVFSSDKDFTLWPEPGTKLEVDLAGCSLDFPVVGGKEAWEKAVGSGTR